MRVLEEFNLEVESQTRSRLIEALIIEFLINHTRDPSIPSGDDKPSLEAEVII